MIACDSLTRRDILAQAPRIDEIGNDELYHQTKQEVVGKKIELRSNK